MAALLSNLGFAPSTSLTMTNKIKDVELVWTLGAMLAKSAELANEGRGGSVSGFRGAMLLAVVLLAVYYLSRRCSPPTRCATRRASPPPSCARHAAPSRRT